MVVPPDLTEVFAVGYNGPPAGINNDRCRHREEGNCGCIHGEANALVRLKTTRTGLVMICTDSPCEHCAGLILNAGTGVIEYVVYDRAYRDRTGVGVLEASGVVCRRRADVL